MARVNSSKIVADRDGQKFRVRRKLVEGLYFVAGRTVIDFSDLRHHVSLDWLLHLINSLQEAFQYKPPNSTIKGALQVKRFLFFVIKSEYFECDRECCLPLLRAIKNNKSLQKEKIIVEQAVHSFIRSINDVSDVRVTDSTSRRTRAAIIEQFQDACDGLCRVDFLPHLEHMPRLSYSPLFHANKSRSLIEIADKIHENASHVELVSKSKLRVFEFRDLFQSILLAHYNDILCWRKKISDDCISLSQIIEAAKTASQKFGKGGRSNRELEAAFPLDDQERLMLSSLRLYQYFMYSDQLTTIPPWARNVIRVGGGMDKLRYLSEGRLKSMMGAYMLVMIDSAVNPQVLDDLPADPKMNRSRLGSADFYTISATKGRAGYRENQIVFRASPLETDVVSLPINVGSSRISSYRAIQIWKEMSEPIRAGQNNADAALLWVTRTNLGCRRYSAQTWAYEWALILEQCAPDLVEGQRQFSRMDLRKTIKQIRAAEYNDNVDLAEAVTQNSSSVLLRSYVHNASSAREFASKIREFQNILESVVVAEKKYEQLRDRDQWEVLEQKAIQTGIGLTCGQYLLAEKAQVACHSLDQCASCSSMRFVPTVQSISDLAWLYVSLERQQEPFSKMNPERWMRVWLPLHALATALRETLLVGPKARTYRSAEAAASCSIADGSRPEFRPW